MFGTSKNIKNPGLNILPPGVERHIVNGGALTAFQIFPNDEIEIIVVFPFYDLTKSRVRS